MIDNYLKELDDFIFTAEEIINVEVVRRSVWDTDLEKIGIYRYRIYLCDGSLLELTERIIEEDGTLKRTKYRYHWQTEEGTLIKRWDNAMHHPEIETFPHHLHDGSNEKVISHEEDSGLNISIMIIEELSKKP